MRKRFILLTAIILTLAQLLTVAAVSADNCPEPLYSNYQNTNDMREDIVQHALSQVGYREGADGSNAFGSSFGNSSGSWCAYFIMWCALKAGVPSSIIPQSRFGRVSDYWENATAVLEFHPVNDLQNPYTPKAGDLVIYRNTTTYYDRTTKKITTWQTSDSVLCQYGTSGNSRVSHIGIVTRDATYPTNNGTKVNYAGFAMVDGNRGGKVASRFELYENITGFVTIKYPSPQPTNPSPSTGTWPLLKKGSSGANVSVLQAMLNKTIGADLTLDGFFGSATEKAVKRYQAWNGLTPDGYVGNDTWISLSRNNVQTSSDYNWSTTRQLQILLAVRYGIETAIDGHYGSQTTASVKYFQKWAGIEQDGKVGPITWRYLLIGK